EATLDGVSQWRSGILRRDDPAQIENIPLKDAKTLELNVEDGGNGLAADHANWADAKLVDGK
ncbi:MAG: NPCBM/NEW2 domain-containing protein, partial [FCB group bacterium]|nr:NPCBM/NEW2 domain-containing protein [FCB group bacterium]